MKEIEWKYEALFLKSVIQFKSFFSSCISKVLYFIKITYEPDLHKNMDQNRKKQKTNKKK